MSKSHIKPILWIISELFYPDETSTAYILTDIANGIEKKYNVKVICGPEFYDKKKTKDRSSSQSLNKNIVIFRTSPINLNKDKLSTRVLRFFIASYKIYRIAKTHINAEDKVLLVTNPPLLILLIAKLKRKIGFEYILLVHDVFPENMKTAGLKIPDFIFKKSKKIIDNAYSKTDKIIVIGRDMKDVIAGKIAGKGHSNITIIENWGDVDSILPKEDFATKTNSITIEYAGNIGRGQNLLPFLQLWSKLKNNVIELSIWGSGAAESSLKLYVNNHDVDNVVFNGPYFRSQQNDVLNSCDIALVTLAHGMYGLGVPSKSYNIMAAGKPILFIGDLKSEIALIIKENEIGYCFENNDIEGLKYFLNNLSIKDKEEFNIMGNRARALAVRCFTKKVIINKFIREI